MKKSRLKSILNQLLFVFTFAVIFISCNNQQTPLTILADEFPVNETLLGDTIFIEGGEKVANIAEPAGDYFVFNAYRGPFCFMVYNQNFELVDTVVRKGKGHDELLNGPMYLGQWRGSKSNPEILVYADVEQKMVDFTLPEFKGIHKMVQLPKSLNLTPKYLYEVTKDKYYGMNLDVVEGGCLFSYDAHSNKLKKCPSPFEYAKDTNYLFYITQQSMAVSKDGDRICTAYNNFPWLALYDSEFNLLKKIAIGEEVDTKFVKMNDEYPGLIHVNFHKDNITVLYSPVNSDEPTSLKIFEKDGNPKASYNVGDAIWYFIDEENSRLITVHYDNEKDLIYLMKYPMPETLK